MRALSDQEVLAGPKAVQHLAEGRPVDIPPAVAVLREVAPFSTRYDLVLPGRRAAFMSKVDVERWKKKATKARVFDFGVD